MNVSTTFAAARSGADASDSGLHGGAYWMLIAAIYISGSILLLQEILFISWKWRRYFCSLESWVKLGALALCACAPWLARAPGAWPRHVACAELLLAWLQAMMLVSRFPRYGFYVLMFGKVAVEMLKILMTAVFLIIGFAFCFMIQYRSAPPFDGPFSAFVKTLVMMSSEFDYEALFGENHADQLGDTATFVRILFIAFVIFVAIVLMNFMIGLAVSDINELNKTGNISRLEKQVELLSTLDSLVYEGVLSEWFTNNFSGKRHPLSMSTKTRHQSPWEVTYATSKNRLSKTLHVKIRSSTLYNAIVETAIKNWERVNKQSGNIDSFCTKKIDALYEAIVDRPVSVNERDKKNLAWLCEVMQNKEIQTLVRAIVARENNENARSVEDSESKN